MNPALHGIDNLEVEKLEMTIFPFTEVICVNPTPQSGARMNTKGGVG
jgi:hypothetical protein